MISFFVRSNRFIIYKKWGIKEILCGAPLYFLNYTLWGKVANFTSSGMRSTYSLITSYQTSSEILTNKIVDPNLLKIWLRENNNSTRLKTQAYQCPYLSSLSFSLFDWYFWWVRRHKRRRTLVTSQLPRSFYLLPAAKKHTKNRAAVTSLRSFLFLDDFSNVWRINCHQFISTTPITHCSMLLGI